MAPLTGQSVGSSCRPEELTLYHLLFCPVSGVCQRMSGVPMIDGHLYTTRHNCQHSFVLYGFCRQSRQGALGDFQKSRRRHGTTPAGQRSRGGISRFANSAKGQQREGKAPAEPLFGAGQERGSAGASPSRLRPDRLFQFISMRCHFVRRSKESRCVPVARTLLSALHCGTQVSGPFGHSAKSFEGRPFRANTSRLCSRFPGLRPGLR